MASTRAQKSDDNEHKDRTHYSHPLPTFHTELSKLAFWTDAP